jgi:hypothetical protein
VDYPRSLFVYPVVIVEAPRVEVNELSLRITPALHSRESPLLTGVQDRPVYFVVDSVLVAVVNDVGVMLGMIESPEVEKQVESESSGLLYFI